MGRALQQAPARHPAAFHYERRRPEETTLYQVVQEQLESFLVQVEARTGSGLPEFVKDELEAFLECGILAVHPELLAPVLRIIQRLIATHLIKQAGIQRRVAATGSITLIQRFDSAANLNIHLHGLVHDGVYRSSGEGAPVFHAARPPNAVHAHHTTAVRERPLCFVGRKSVAPSAA